METNTESFQKCLNEVTDIAFDLMIASEDDNISVSTSCEETIHGITVIIAVHEDGTCMLRTRFFIAKLRDVAWFSYYTDSLKLSIQNYK